MTKEYTDQEVDELSDRYYNRSIDRVNAALGVPVDPGSRVVKDGLQAIYQGSYDRDAPSDVVVYESPQAMLEAEGESTSSGIGAAVVDLVERIASARELLDESMTDDESALREFAYSVYDGLLGDQCVALVGWPHTYRTDDDGQLHCVDGPAVAWPGQAEYYWHGQAVDKVAIENPDAVTAEHLKNLSAEQRRATYEAIGHDRAIKALGLTVCHTETINGLRYELYRSDEESWLRMQSPPLKDGSQPYYVEPVHEDCETCGEALGWRAEGELGRSVQYEIET